MREREKRSYRNIQSLGLCGVELKTIPIREPELRGGGCLVGFQQFGITGHTEIENQR